jgi:polyhydroxybutyrate depolymerase
MGGSSPGVRAAVVVAVSLLACAPPRPPAQSPRYPRSGDFAQEVGFAGGTRQYILHLPPDYAKHVPLPVVLAFHGGGGGAAAFQGAAGLDAQADALGWAVVYPDGSGHLDRRLLTWNAGSCCGSAQEGHVDDVGFAVALLADLARDLDLDPTRVYAVGHSNGGMMAYRLAAREGARIAAVASVAGPDMSESFPSGPPVPVLHIHSVDDPRATYQGGESRTFAFVSNHVAFRSVDDTLARWRGRDGCTGDGRVVDERKLESHRAELVDFGPCAGGADVRLWRLHGPGHGWPGGRSWLPATLIGPGTQVIRASEEIFRFLPRFSKPDAPRLR